MFGALVQWFEGSFKVFEKIGNVTYILEMQDHMKSHHQVFRIIHSKPCRIDEGDPSIFPPSRATTLIVGRIEL
jgi:hypothetical protein